MPTTIAQPPQSTMEPAAIERLSFAIIDAETPEPRPFTGHHWEVARRLVHTSADFELLSLLRFHPLAVTAGLEALRSGATIVTDTRMAQMGIPLRRLDALGATSVCLMNDPAVMARAKEQGVTRARVAMDMAANITGPVIFAIGNAPTALLRLLELLDAGQAAPALIVGMPVGFVNAAESKETLMAQDRVPYVAIAGRKGGSALAAATVNALAEIVLREKAGG